MKPRWSFCAHDHKALKPCFQGANDGLKEGTTSVQYLILGPLEVRDGDVPVPIGGSKQRAVLGLLLLHANEVISRDRLVHLLWEGRPPDTAATALQVYVSQLRKSLGREAIKTQPPGYAMVIEPAALDLVRFRQLVEQARSEAPATAAATLREALALWRGPPLADIDEGIAATERAQLDAERVAALEERIDVDLELGRHRDLVPELQALVRQDPLRERYRAQLMLALYRSGRQAEALAEYRGGRRFLADELGLEPGPALRRLEKAILDQDPALDRPEEVRARDRQARRQVTRARALLAAGAFVLAVALAAAAVALTRSSQTKSVVVEANSVAVIDARTGRVKADVPIGGRPISIAVGAGSVWVVDADDQTLVRIDRKTFRVTKVIGGLGTDVSAVAFGSGSVWLAGGNDGTLVRVDPNANVATATHVLARAAGGAVEPVFFVAAARGAVWATAGNELVKVDPSTGAAVGSVRVPAPVGLAANSRAAWVCRLDESLVRVERSGPTVTASSVLSHGLGPSALLGGSLWLRVDAAMTQFWRVDPLTLVQESVASVPGPLVLGLATGGGALWTTDHLLGTVWRIDPDTGRVRALVRLPHHPVALAEANGSLWVGVQPDRFT